MLDLDRVLFERVGIARCDTVSQFLETIKLLSIAGPLSKASVGSMSCSGGDASLAADFAEHLQMEFPTLSATSARSLKELLGPNVNVSNPLDYHLYIWGNYEQLRQCFYQVLSNQFGCTLLILDYPPGGSEEAARWEIAERALISAVADTSARAVVVSSLPETLPDYVRERLKAAGIAPMQGIEDCLFAIKSAALVGKAQRNAGDIHPVLAAQATANSAKSLDEPSSKQALAEYGLAIPTATVCTPGDTVDAANKIGYPVVLKAVSSELAHKSESGAVAINLHDEHDVRTATQSLSTISEQILVESMAQSVVSELIVGVTRDPTFGLTLTIGAGGILVELVEDSVSLLLPVQREDISAALKKLKVYKLLQGYRGKAAGDIESVVDSVEAIARYAIAHNDSLLELDVNPLCVLTEGSVAVDAFIRTTK